MRSYTQRKQFFQFVPNQRKNSGNKQKTRPPIQAETSVNPGGMLATDERRSRLLLGEKSMPVSSTRSLADAQDSRRLLACVHSMTDGVGLCTTSAPAKIDTTGQEIRCRAQSCRVAPRTRLIPPRIGLLSHLIASPVYLLSPSDRSKKLTPDGLRYVYRAQSVT